LPTASRRSKSAIATGRSGLWDELGHTDIELPVGDQPGPSVAIDERHREGARCDGVLASRDDFIVQRDGAARDSESAHPRPVGRRRAGAAGVGRGGQRRFAREDGGQVLALTRQGSVGVVGAQGERRRIPDQGERGGARAGDRRRGAAAVDPGDAAPGRDDPAVLESRVAVRVDPDVDGRVHFGVRLRAAALARHAALTRSAALPGDATAARSATHTRNAALPRGATVRVPWLGQRTAAGADPHGCEQHRREHAPSFRHRHFPEDGQQGPCRQMVAWNGPLLSTERPARRDPRQCDQTGAAA